MAAIPAASRAAPCRSQPRAALVALALAALVPACSLYFPDGPDRSIPDAAPGQGGGGGGGGGDPGGSEVMARCEGGELRRVAVAPWTPTLPGHGAGALIGRCAGGCRSAAVVCREPTCAAASEALCGAPPATGAACPLEGTACTGAGSIACPQTTTCGLAVPGTTCTCTDGRQRCAAPTDVPLLYAALVGRWEGMVSPPSFTTPYPVSMWIYPDGTYWAEAIGRPYPSAFYYGGDGPHPSRRIDVLSAAPRTGAYADIGVYFGSVPANTGAIAGLVVGESTLQFTFYASWFGCGQPFGFTLHRVGAAP